MSFTARKIEDISSDNEEEEEKADAVKEARMTTNKKKATNVRPFSCAIPGA